MVMNQFGTFWWPVSSSRISVCAEIEKVAGQLVWRVRSGVLVEQRPAEAVARCLDLAEEQLREAGPGRDNSAADAVSLGRRFLTRHHNELDARFGRTSA